MNDKEKEQNILRRIIFIAFVVFAIFYIGQGSGYYEAQNQKKKVLTEEQIKVFEDDINSGKKVDISEYTQKVEVNYNNGIAKAGLFVSDKIGKILSKAITATFTFLEGAISEE